MPPKTSAADEEAGFLARWYERGEEAFSQVLEEWLGNPKVTDRLGKTVGRAADAKRRVDRNMQFFLSLLNVPSRADYNRLLAKIEALQGSIVNLNMKLDRLLAAQQEHPRPRRRAAKRGANLTPPP